jgi:hypothetical protein
MGDIILVSLRQRYLPLNSVKRRMLCGLETANTVTAHAYISRPLTSVRERWEFDQLRPPTGPTQFPLLLGLGHPLPSLGQ